MNKPTKEEMLEKFDEMIRNEYDLLNDYPMEEVDPIINAIRSLIEKHGDGGPKVKADDVRRAIQDATEETDGEGLSYQSLFTWLRSIGVVVEE